MEEIERWLDLLLRCYDRFCMAWVPYENHPVPRTYAPVEHLRKRYQKVQAKLLSVIQEAINGRD